MVATSVADDGLDLGQSPQLLGRLVGTADAHPAEHGRRADAVEVASELLLADGLEQPSEHGFGGSGTLADGLAARGAGPRSRLAKQDEVKMAGIAEGSLTTG